MKTTPWNKVTATNAEEYTDGVWLTEASALQIRPGYRPARLETDLGNERPFNLTDFDDECWNYTQPGTGFRLHVAND